MLFRSVTTDVGHKMYWLAATGVAIAGFAVPLLLRKARQHFLYVQPLVRVQAFFLGQLARVFKVTAANVVNMIVPNLINPLRKGQKTSLDPQNRGLQRLKACFGWNIKDARCDMDASAFLITNTGKVPGDEWFVFYGQTESPDNSVQFGTDPSHKDREVISVNLQRLNRSIQKIVFVLTINEAFENNLNFSMIKDAYIRILNGSTNQEIVSYKLDEYYSNVTSMTIGELYIHNGQWKFNPVGNGVHQDLAGQCAIYGVEIA